MPRHRSPLLACLFAAVLALAAALPASAAPKHSSASLAGTWQVKRSCMAGCKGTTTATETVSPHGANIFLASGSADLALYLVGKQVLVHSENETTLLTIKTSGQLMSGSGIADDGSTFSSTWRCTAAATAQNLGASVGLAPRASSARQATC